MAKFLDGAGVQSALTDIIKNADKELVLISPYLKIPQQTRQYLNSIDKKINSVKIIYRTDFKISSEDLEFFRTLHHLELFHCDNLHSKCYLNENTGLITSMNLHEHSQTHNWEMGVRFSKQLDPDIYDEVRKELSHLVNEAKPHILTRAAPDPKPSPRAEPVRAPVKKSVYKPTEAPNKGIFDKILDKVTGEAAYCIRCGDGMPKFDLNKPYCDRCYAIWSRYRNPRYPEKYCHGCGNETKDVIMFEKPTCKSCFKEFYPK